MALISEHRLPESCYITVECVIVHGKVTPVGVRVNGTGIDEISLYQENESDVINVVQIT